MDVSGDPLIQKWLSSVQNKNTQKSYYSAVKTFFGWLGQTPTEFVKAIIEDNKKDVLEKQDLARNRILEFYNYATTDMPKRDHYNMKIIGKGLSFNAATSLINGIRSFLTEFGIVLKFKGRHAMRQTERNPNERMKLNVDQVRSMLMHARLPRDRAIITFLAQSGCDLNTLVNMKYKIMQSALEKNEIPAKIDLFRQKAAIPYYTFIASDSIEAIKVYLGDLRQRGIELKPNDFLWLSEKGHNPLRELNVQKTLRIVAEKAGLIAEGDPFNIAGGHALREFFSSTLYDAKVQEKYIDEMLGHKPSQMDAAYFKSNPELIRAEYARCMDLLSLNPKINNGVLQKKIDLLVDERTKELEKSIVSLTQDNVALKQKMEQDQKAQEDRLKALEEALKDLKKIVNG